jgi:hypothetical protein
MPLDDRKKLATNARYFAVTADRTRSRVTNLVKYLESIQRK